MFCAFWHFALLKGRFADGLKIDKRLVSLRPTDALAHYNLACSYVRMNRRGLSIKTLRRAVELGYRVYSATFVKTMIWIPFVKNPRFRKLMQDYENC
jgi:hypothetical protein